MELRHLEIPEEVSGRKITNRGVHLQAFGFHGVWLESHPYWTELMRSMNISWAVLLNTGDSVLQEYHTGISPIRALLDAGVVPVIREQAKFPQPFTDFETVERTVEIYGEYGLKPFWIIRNEPFDDREWIKGHPPRDDNKAWHIIMRVWTEAAQFIAKSGGYVGFPDGPCFDRNPFEQIKAWGGQWIFDQNKGFYTGHHYGKNRPRDYPYDEPSQNAFQLTEEAYMRMLDDYAEDPRWHDAPVELLNAQRRSWEDPGKTALEDDTCWRGWEKIAWWSQNTFGYVVPMAMTEGGWVPRDRAGGGPNTDIRMPHTTPRMVAKKTRQMYDTPSPFFAICPWLLADEDMGSSGWPFDAWHGWAYYDKYGSKKPVIPMLQALEPKEFLARPRIEVLDANGDSMDWMWVEEKFAAEVQLEAGTYRLIGLHETANRPSAWVVDEHGFAVSDVPVWCDADTRRTGADGRVRFSEKQPQAIVRMGIHGSDLFDYLARDTMLGGMWMKVTDPSPEPPEPEPDPDLEEARRLLAQTRGVLVETTVALNEAEALLQTPDTPDPDPDPEEYPSYGLLGAHVNAAAIGNVAEELKFWQPPVVVSLDHSVDTWRGVKEASPQTVFIGRVVSEEYGVSNPDFNPRYEAQKHCELVLPHAERMGDIYTFWQGHNEQAFPKSGQPAIDAMKRYCDFEFERMRIMQEHGYKVILGSFSVGTPELFLWAYFVPVLRAMKALGNGALGLHQYGWPGMDPLWLEYRHEFVYDGCPDPAHDWNGLPELLMDTPLYLLECGYDGGVQSPGWVQGWRGQVSLEAYMMYLHQFDQRLQKAPYIKGAAVYCVCSGEWITFALQPEVIGELKMYAEPVYR